MNKKLGYEWKNIYRMFLQLDRNQTSQIEIGVFDAVCQQFRVHVSNEEISKMKKNYCMCIESDNNDESNNVYMLNYTDFSNGIQLHKDSFNFMRNQLIKGSTIPKYNLAVFKKQKRYSSIS